MQLLLLDTTDSSSTEHAKNSEIYPKEKIYIYALGLILEN